MKKDNQYNSILTIIFNLVGVIVVLASAAYGLYKFFTPDYLDDFEDDYVEDIDTKKDFFDEEENTDVEEAVEEKAAEQEEAEEPEEGELNASDEDIFAE